MFYTRELFVPYSRIFRYWLRLVNGAVISTSDPCTTHAAVRTHIFEINRQAGIRLSASSSTCRFGKFGGQIPPVIANR